MFAMTLVCTASLFLAAANLLMRKSLDAGGTTKTYLLLQLSTCFVITFFLGPVKSGSYAINGPIIALGALTGFVLIGILTALGKALEKGPPGLTFAILSAAAVFPGLIMATLFGQAHGFEFTIWHGVGSLFVLVGLFWAGRQAPVQESVGSGNRFVWVLLVSIMFGLHIAILCLYQWRALMLPTSVEMQSEWFVPMMYIAAMSVQAAIVFKTEWRRPNRKEWAYGIGGGLCNSLCTLFLLQGTNLANGLEHSIIFPTYCIGTIVFSNLWSQRLYGEKVNWRACHTCLFGIVLGSMNWKLVLGFFS